LWFAVHRRAATANWESRVMSNGHPPTLAPPVPRD